jgi:hypothetical protein
MTDHWQIRLERILTDYLQTQGIGAPIFAGTSTGERVRPCVVVGANVQRPNGNRHLSAVVEVMTLTNANDTTDAEAQDISSTATDALLDVDAWKTWVDLQTTTYRTGWAIRKRWLVGLDIDTDSSENTRNIRQEVGIILET